MHLIALAALPALGLASVTAFYSTAVLRFLGYHRHTQRALPVASRQLLPHLREVGAYLHLGAWQVAHLARSPKDHNLSHDAHAGPPVLCLHGFTQSGANFVGLRKQLRKLGRPTWALHLGMPPKSIERYAAPLVAALDELGATGPFDVVAHSMGGVVLRYALSHSQLGAANVRRIITLGSPHLGTAGARGLLARPFPEVGQMGRRSAWLQALPHFSALAPQAEVTTIASDTDSIVYPVETATLPGARAIQLSGVGHAGLLVGRALRELVIETLCAPPPAALREA